MFRLLKRSHAPQEPSEQRSARPISPDRKPQLQQREVLARNDSNDVNDTSTSGTPSETIEERKTQTSLTNERKNDRGLLLWWPELAAMTLSIACLAAVIIVLLRIDGTPLQRWSMPWHVKPNTLVSILITASRVFMLSVLVEGLIVKIRWRAMVASIGALLIILTLAMDPLAQQLVSYELQTAPGPGATIGSARIYGSLAQSGTTHVSADSGTNFALVEAALVALFTRDETMEFSCKSGNCTWPTFRTLKLCSHCEDVSSTIEKECTTYTSHDLKHAPEQDCNYTTPLGARLKASSQCGELGDYRTLWRTATGFSASPGATVVNVSAIFFPYDSETSLDTTLGCPLPNHKAWDCTISWCAKTYSASASTDGRLQDVPAFTELLSILAFDDPDMDCYTHPGYSYGSYYRSNEGAVLLSAAFTPSEMPQTFTCPDTNLFKNSATAFWINSADMLLFAGELQPFFRGGIINGQETSNNAMNHPAATASMQAMYKINGGNFSMTMESLATSMTNFIRQGPNSTAVLGHEHYTTTHIRINWPWLCFPAGLVVVAVVFLIAAIISSHTSSKTGWKSSSLAILFHGLDGWIEQEVRDHRSTRGMQMAAKDMWAKLSEGDDGNLKLTRTRM